MDERLKDTGDNKRRSFRFPTKRRLIQLFSALLYNAHLKGFVTGSLYKGSAKALCVPGLNCYSCPAAVGSCPLGALQTALAASKHRIGFYVFGIIMLYGLILGRTVCGFLCPFGLLQELLHKIPSPKIKKSRVTRILSGIKYPVLFVFAMGISLWSGLGRSVPVPAFCKFICPAGVIEGALPLLSHPDNTGYFKMLGGLFVFKCVVALLMVLICVFCYRAFCRFLCPLGAIYGFFGRLSVLGVRVEGELCNGCGECVKKCPMDVKSVGDSECIHCAKCVAHCPTGAIAMKAGRTTLKVRE